MKASELIDKQIAETPGWKGEYLSRLRKIINDTYSGLTEEWKWGTAVWAKNGLVCAISSYKDHIKINFFKGAKLRDPNKLINAGFGSKQHRAIDFKEGDEIKESKLKELIMEAVTLNK